MPAIWHKVRLQVLCYQTSFSVHQMQSLSKLRLKWVPVIHVMQMTLFFQAPAVLQPVWWSKCAP